MPKRGKRLRYDQLGSGIKSTAAIDRLTNGGNYAILSLSIHILPQLFFVTFSIRRLLVIDLHRSSSSPRWVLLQYCKQYTIR